MLRVFSSFSERIADLLGRQHGFTRELARDLINSSLKAQKRFSPVDFPFSSFSSSNLGCGLVDHMLSLRTENINVKLLQFPLSHSLGVDSWWEGDLLLPQGQCNLGTASCPLSPSLPPSIPEHGARLLAFCLPGSQKLSECSLRGYSVCPGGRLSQNEMKQEEAVPFSLNDYLRRKSRVWDMTKLIKGLLCVLVRVLWNNK